MRVTPALHDRVLELSSQGLSQHKIARETKLSRGTISGILKGTVKPAAENFRFGYEPVRFASSLARRCPGCGGKVKMPCKLCRVRAVMEK